jgi:hypothetical protein
VTNLWKAFDKGYNFALNIIAIEGLHVKLWAPKVTIVPTMGNPSSFLHGAHESRNRKLFTSQTIEMNIIGLIFGNHHKTL